jgi:hypothetical protein
MSHLVSIGYKEIAARECATACREVVGPDYNPSLDDGSCPFDVP